MVSYSEKKKEMLNELKAINEFLDLLEKEIGEKLNKDVLKEWKHKIKKTISNIENEKFSIVFFGSFSDGKSTILSALTKSLDIKISVEPTTDKIKEYKFGDYFIIDTPGLFSDQLMHDEKTKKYISEANIVIYTVDAVNPLKESHHETLKWLLKDLGKIDSTIFVINKMDEVADLEDEEDFKRNCEIKKEVVVDVLKQVIGLPNFERIVCMSGNPFGLGLREWFDKENEYKRLSRIEDLENLINNFIEEAKNELVIKSGLSTLKDIVIKILNDLQNIYVVLNKQNAITSNLIKEYQNKLTTQRKDINTNYTHIKEDILALRDDILQEIETALNTQNLQAISEKRFGKEGYILKEKINLIVSKHTESLTGETQKFLKDIKESSEYYSNLTEDFLSATSTAGKYASGILAKTSNRQLADTILKIRDITELPITFKPWGAIKFAEKLSSTCPIIAEFIDIGSKIYNKFTFNNKKKEMKEQIEEFFKELNKKLSLKEYIDEYFPYVADVEKIIEDLEKNRNEIQKEMRRIEKFMNTVKNFSVHELPIQVQSHTELDQIYYDQSLENKSAILTELNASLEDNSDQNRHKNTNSSNEKMIISCKVAD